MATAVSTANMQALADLGVGIPRYDRRLLAPRIVHVGVGGFHRAHMALYAHELADAGSDWGILGVGLIETDRGMAEVLVAQDCLYTLIARDASATDVRIVGSIVDYAFAATDATIFAAHLTRPEVAILSLTVTEGGYRHGTNTTMDAIAGALDARRQVGGGPLTVLSCDNLPGNGDAARDALLPACERRSEELRRWAEDSCAFPNSMVDRITPQTTDADRTWLNADIGIEDEWPVVCEPFRQWVIEDLFAADRPPLEDVGVLISEHVNEWELYKLRILNATHSCMAYLMALAGIRYVDQAVALPSVRGYLNRFVIREAIPTLVEIPGHPPREYWQTVLHRYKNTAIRDQIGRLCIDGTAKFSTFLIPTVEHQLKFGGPLDLAALALASWAEYLATTPARERASDPDGERAAAFAARSISDPTAFLEFDRVFTPRVRNSEPFADAFADALRLLRSRGPLGAIEASLDGD